MAALSVEDEQNTRVQWNAEDLPLQNKKYML